MVIMEGQFSTELVLEAAHKRRGKFKKFVQMPSNSAAMTRIQRAYKSNLASNANLVSPTQPLTQPHLANTEPEYSFPRLPESLHDGEDDEEPENSFPGPPESLYDSEYDEEPEDSVPGPPESLHDSEYDEDPDDKNESLHDNEDGEDPEDSFPGLPEPLHGSEDDEESPYY